MVCFNKYDAKVCYEKLTAILVLSSGRSDTARDDLRARLQARYHSVVYSVPLCPRPSHPHGRHGRHWGGGK